MIQYTSTIWQWCLFYLDAYQELFTHLYLLCTLLVWTVSHIIASSSLAWALKMYDDVLDLSLISSLTNVFKILNCLETTAAEATQERVVAYFL